MPPNLEPITVCKLFHIYWHYIGEIRDEMRQRDEKSGERKQKQTREGNSELRVPFSTAGRSISNARSLALC